MAGNHQQKLAHALLPLAQLSSAVLRAAGTTGCSARFAEIQRVFQGPSDVSGLLKGVRRAHSTLHTAGLYHGSYPLHVYQHVAPACTVVTKVPFYGQHGREWQHVVLHQGWHQSRHFRTQSINLKESTSTPEDCDRIVEEMRYRNIKVPKQLEISWRRRMEGWVAGAWNGAKAVVKFSFSLPGMFYRTITMSPSEWYKFLSGTWATVKHEAEYYWMGFRLFGFELRVASGLVWKRLKGVHLSRRERRQLTRTSADLIRMIPFSLFIIIPFAEALLPLAIRLFPNLLPSTFETPLKREEDLKKLLKLKTELAGFLQQTVGELAKDVKKSSSGEVADEAKALQVFLSDVRDGKSVNNNDIVKFARLFNDELTLDNLDRVHLLTLCQFLSLPTIPGTEAILRTRLQAHLVEIRADDIEIKSEGIENLTDDEMRSASRARGMPAPFGRGCTSLLRKQLSEWIELSLDKNIPSSLLLLSRAFKMTTLAKRAPSADKPKDSATETVESLKNTINMLPEEAIEGVEMERFKSSAGLQKRLEYLRREEEEIKEENEEENSKELSDARAALEESHSRLGKVVTTSAQATAKAVVRKAAAEAAQDAISKKQEESGDSAQSQVAYKDAREKEKKMGALISSLVALAHASGVAQERELFMEVASREVESQMVKLGGGSYLEFGGAKKEVSGVRPAEERVDHVTENMQASIHNMLIRIESELDAADSTIGQKLHLLDTDADGIVSKDELLNAMTLLRGNRSEAEANAVKKLLDGRQTVTLEQLEELGQKLTLSKVGKDEPTK